MLNFISPKHSKQGERDYQGNQAKGKCENVPQSFFMSGPPKIKQLWIASAPNISE